MRMRTMKVPTSSSHFHKELNMAKKKVKKKKRRPVRVPGRPAKDVDPEDVVKPKFGRKRTPRGRR